MFKGLINKFKFDNKLFIIICLLICIGLLALASASSYTALSNFNNSSYFLIRQLTFAIVGIFLMLVISRIDYKILKNKIIAYGGYLGTIVLMLLVLVPGIGVEVKGATRWIGLGPLQFQPSEIMKFALIIAISYYIVNNYSKLKSIFSCYIPMIMLFGVCAVMAVQEHLSGTAIMIAGTIGVLFSSGLKLKVKYIIIIMVLVLGIGVAFIFSSPFRIERVKGFLNPDADPLGTNFQRNQSLYALGTGSVFGLGFGQSRQKYLWLPEAQNDFIFSVWGEETGIIGTISVLILFALFILRGYKVAMTCRDLFGALIASRNNYSIYDSNSY